MKILAKYSGDWADEFQCEEFKVFQSQEDYNVWVNAVKLIIDKGHTEFYFGSNEYNTFDRIEDLTGNITTFELTEEEAEVFFKYFQFTYGGFGTGNIFSIDPDDVWFDDEY